MHALARHARFAQTAFRAPFFRPLSSNSLDELTHVLVDGRELKYSSVHKLMGEWDVAWHHRLNPVQTRAVPSAYVFGFEALSDAERFVTAMRRRRDVRARLLDVAAETPKAAAFEEDIASDFDRFENDSTNVMDVIEEEQFLVPQTMGWNEPSLPPSFAPPPKDVDAISEMKYEPTATEDEIKRRVKSYNIMHGFRAEEQARAGAHKDSPDPFNIEDYLSDLAAASSSEAGNLGGEDGVEGGDSSLFDEEESDMDFLDRLSSAAHGGAEEPLDEDLHKEYARAEAKWRESQLRDRIRKDQKLKERLERISKRKVKRKEQMAEPLMTSKEYADVILREREQMFGRKPTDAEIKEIRENAMTVEERMQTLIKQRGRGELLDPAEQDELLWEAKFGEHKGPWMETLINVDQVTKVIPGGSVRRFRALTVAGNLNGAVGFGVAKGHDVQTAVNKSFRFAKRNLIVRALIRGGGRSNQRTGAMASRTRG
eukprot:scaffold848_cov247-Pinguiococcus_pyrenoidosus.AAC.13